MLISVRVTFFVAVFSAICAIGRCQDDLCSRFKDEYDAFCRNLGFRQIPTFQDRCDLYEKNCVRERPDATTVDPSSPCVQFGDQYRHFCVKGTPPTEPSVIASCQRFFRECLSGVTTTTERPFNNAEYLEKVLPMLELAGVPAAQKGVFASCLASCDQDELTCIYVCECQHYAPIMLAYCGRQTTVLTSQGNCNMWYAKCGIAPDAAPTRDPYDFSRSVDHLYLKPFDHSAEFYRNSKRVAVDWVNGRVGGVEKLQVPAVGFGIDLNEFDVNFPSIGAFGPGGSGFQIPGAGKRKRRR